MGVQFTEPAYGYNTAALPTAGSSFTVCGWYRVDVDGNDYDGLFEIYGTDYFGLITDVDGTSLRVAVNGNDSNMYAAMTVGVWMFVAVVYGPAGTVTWYYANEGSALTTGSNSGVSTSLSLGTGFVIGGWPQYSAYASCSTAYVRHWSSALTAGEVATERASATAVKTTGLVREYRMPNSGAIADDSSGNGRTLTPTGTTAWTADPTNLGVSGRRRAPTRAGGARMNSNFY